MGFAFNAVSQCSLLSKNTLCAMMVKEEDDRNLRALFRLINGLRPVFGYSFPLCCEEYSTNMNEKLITALFSR